MIEIDREDFRLADEEPLFPRDWEDACVAPSPKAKRVRRSTIRQIEKECGRVVTAVTESKDGTRRYELAEKVDVPVEIETPEQLRRLI